MNNNSESNLAKIFFESFSNVLKRDKASLDLFEEQINECKKLYLTMSESDENSSFYSSLSNEKKAKLQESCQLLQEVIEQQESILNELKAIYQEQEKLLKTKELNIEHFRMFTTKFKEGVNIYSRLNKENSFFKSCLEACEKTPYNEGVDFSRCQT